MNKKRKGPKSIFTASLWTVVSLLWWYQFVSRREMAMQGMAVQGIVSVAWVLAALTAGVALCWWVKVFCDWRKSRKKHVDDGGDDNG